MKIETKYFGEAECEKEELIHFEDGLFGFEEQKDFLPIPFAEDNDGVLCLQSVQDAQLAFVVMNPFMLLEDYNPVLTKEDYDKLGSVKEEDLSFYVICVLHEKTEESTLNMRCPVAVNAVTRKARQVVLEAGEYPFRYPLGEVKAGR